MSVSLHPKQWDAVKELFSRCLKLEPELREALLAKSRDPAQVKNEVRRLLQHAGDEPSMVDIFSEQLIGGPESLRPGTRIGPYELLTPIGRGGMGEVYRARDTRLGRDVAIKFPAHVFSERFEREAKAIASLNHKNICHLYDVGPNYLVMELVEGESLHGPIEMEQAIPLIHQMVDGIEAAHDRGILHRDLKPANIIVTPESVVKILDFGLAKAADAGPTEPLKTRLAADISAPEILLGTVSYMSPEQIRGAEADRRSDIWSFGVVLYELLSAKRPFKGETHVEILDAVLHQEPEWTAVPDTLRPLLQRCLQKDRRNRLGAISDVRWMIEQAVQPAGDHPESKGSRQSRLAWIAAAVLGLAAIALGLGYYGAKQPATLKPIKKFEVDLGPGVSLGTVESENATLSPDGSRLAFASKGKLYVRELDQLESRALPGTEGGYGQFFSPDGKWIGFFTSTKLKKMEVDGGKPIDICDVPSGRGASWGENGMIVASLSANSAVMQVSERGGVPTALTHMEEGEVSHRWPQMLPGGKGLLYTAYVGQNNVDQASIVAMTLPDRRRRVLQRGAAYGRYVATYGQTGHLLFVDKGVLYAVPFDPRTLTQGTPERVLDDVAYKNNGIAEFSAAGTPAGSGTLLYQRGAGIFVGTQRTIQWLDSSGKAQPLAAKPDSYSFLSLAPGGDRVAMSMADAWVYDIRRDIMTRMSFDNGQQPSWTPDGKYIVFRKVGVGLLWTRADGGGHPLVLVSAKNQILPGSFSPDGKTFVYGEAREGVGADLWTVPIEINAAGLKAGTPQPFVQTPYNERSPAFSPDGRWIGYASDESGSFQIYVRAFPNNGSKWQISNDGGVYPRFSGTGHELFYRTEDSSKIYVVNYTAKGDSFIADKPSLWMERQLFDSQIAFINYDVAADGKRIIAFMPVETPEAQQARSHIVLLENFYDELKRKAPAK